jgi:hypothetical protein
MPAIPGPAGGKTIALARTAILVTVSAWLAFVVTTIGHVFLSGRPQTLRTQTDAVAPLPFAAPLSRVI